MKMESFACIYHSASITLGHLLHLKIMHLNKCRLRIVDQVVQSFCERPDSDNLLYDGVLVPLWADVNHLCKSAEGYHSSTIWKLHPQTPTQQHQARSHTAHIVHRKSRTRGMMDKEFEYCTRYDPARHWEAET
jgi:hypothetical protein